MRHQDGTRKALWVDRNVTVAGSFPLAGPKHQIRRTSLPMAGPKHQIDRTSLPLADRNIRFAGPPCLWSDRDTNLCAPRRAFLPMVEPAIRFEICKVTKWQEGCSCRKHGHRKQSVTRILLSFPFPLTLYAKVLSKPVRFASHVWE